MEPKQHDFSVEIYKQIRSEVNSLLIRIENLFRYSLVATVVVFSWLLTQALDVKGSIPCLTLPKDALFIAWIIPPIFILFSSVIAITAYIRINQISEFLKICERTLGWVFLSWEIYLEKKPPLFAITTVLA